VRECKYTRCSVEITCGVITIGHRMKAEDKCLGERIESSDHRIHRLTKTNTQKLRQQLKQTKSRSKQIVGSGAYNFKPMMASLKNELKPLMKRALIGGGGALGAYTGVGRGIGSEVGRRISRLMGSGDYTMNEVSVNSLIKGAGNPTSSFSSTDGTSVRLQHREFLGDITTGAIAGTFNNNAFAINPGIKTSFPYLSQIADNFEMYCFHGLVFEFISTASPYITTSSLGSVIAGAEYNASVPAFASKFAMENSNCAISTRIDKSLMYGLECAQGTNAQNCYYVRSGLSDLPLTTTDIGTFQFATAPGSSFPVNSVVGELWVTYDVSLSRPFLVLSRFGTLQVQRGTTTEANPLGTADLITLSRSGSLSDATVGTSTITIPKCIAGDVFSFNCFWSGAATTATNPVLTYVNCALVVGGISGKIDPATTPQPTLALTTMSGSHQFVQASSSGTISVTFAYVVNGIPDGNVSIDIVSVGNYNIPPTVNAFGSPN